MSGQMMPPGLYIVATPIGNLRDMTLRAIDVLSAADLIACEDTRVSGKLLSHFGINAATISYNDHNGEQRRPAIFKALAEGKRVALVSDAGTPLVSDPGYKLVRDAIEQGFYVTALPGASSVMAALCVAGLPTDRFFFAGFLPAKQEAARSCIQELRQVPATLIWFESARRLEESLALLLEELGDRPAAVVRELTKLFEEAQRGSLSELLAHYREKGEPKGEVVLLVGAPQAQAFSQEDISTKLALLLKSQSVKEASSIVSEETGLPRKEVYTLALKIMKDNDNQ
jgi:16S rRNA (cytidine1402-2'-O)-methyltransferase